MAGADRHGRWTPLPRVGRIRVVMTKLGLDSHYRGVMVVSRYLAMRGMEVIYLGNQLPEQVVSAVVAEDADVLGISSLSGSHLVMVPPVIAGLRERGLDRVSVLVGGIIPAEHLDALREVGVDRVFGPGVALADIAEHIERRVAGRHRVSDPR